ncbi:TOTE conflict system archaeo-eukaryotic primase domain-containing protein [Thalassobacillus hwangdonensis]|uniref:TOTE conflict system primase domain-containing protein n=1 Tax=Thalassobacillus hwangdonensis TaxID=546108 RepID=A0ABW3L0Q1_9BACI
MEQPIKQLTNKFNELYIQTRSKYLVQFPEGKYVTLSYAPDNRVAKFNDSMVPTHLKGDLTYGIFSGGPFSKFITFDVDCAKESLSKWITLKLVYTLETEYAINRKDIHVSYSGNKGYHVDLFFNEQVRVEDLREFFKSVLIEVGDIPEGEIEFRPSWTQGVKLPLGVHQQTGNRCWYVDNYTLEPIESYEYILGIKPMSATLITDTDFGLTDEQIKEFEKVASSTDITVNAVDLSGALQRARKIIETGRLMQSGTRHKTTFTLACFGNSQGWEEEEAVGVIMDILLATPRNYFSEGSTPEYWRKEAERLVGYVFKNDITVKESDQSLTIYKSEILAVLGCGTFRQKQLAYAMLITSKRYGNIFYLTINTAMKMIGTKSRPTVVTAIKKLIECGFIEYHRKAEVDRARSLETGQVRYKPNKYKLAFECNQDEEKSVEVSAEKGMVEVALMLCDIKEIREFVKRREFEGRWQAHTG